MTRLLISSVLNVGQKLKARRLVFDKLSTEFSDVGDMIVALKNVDVRFERSLLNMRV
jgi:hypothetical protein